MATTNLPTGPIEPPAPAGPAAATTAAGAAAATRFGGLRRITAAVREARGVPKFMLWTGAVITALFVLTAVFAPLVAPYDFDTYRSGGTNFPKQGAPDGDHWFGTTVQSLDVLSRTVYGARTALEVMVLAVVFSLVLGVLLGLLSGYFGGWLDRILVLVMDALFAFPYLLLAIVAGFVFSGIAGGGVITAALSITVVYIPQYYRVVRASALSAREAAFVEAARAMGARPSVVIRKYLFGNVIQSVPVITTMNAADGIATLAGLGFLGLGIQPTEAAEWGYDLERAIDDVNAGMWWTCLYPGLAMVIVILGFTLLGEGLNDVLNPTMRRRRISKVLLPAYTPRPTVTAPVIPAASATPAAPVIPAPATSNDAPEGEAAQVTEPVLSVRDLRVWYGTERGAVRAVDGVSFDVRPGETLGLVGESGCGKSTLGRGVLGLTPAAAAVDGEVVLRSPGGAGRDLVGLPPKELQKLRGPDLGLIFQEPMTRLNPLMRISQHFEEALRAHHRGLSKKEVRARALAALRGMGIPESRYTSYPHEFSGGMRQRIMIALALVLRPAFIVADEPTTALDVLVEAQIIKILADLRKNFDTSLVLITHNLGIVAEACDRVAVMYAGHIVEQGDAREVFARPQHPYTRELLRSTISLATTGLHYIPGSPPDLVEPPAGCRFHPRCPVAMRGCAQAEPPEVLLPTGTVSACWQQALDADPALAAHLGPDGREPLHAVEEISVADEA